MFCLKMTSLFLLRLVVLCGEAKLKIGGINNTIFHLFKPISPLNHWTFCKIRFK